MRRFACALALVACGEPAPPVAPGTRAAPGSEAAPVKVADPEAARALFDESVRRHLAGDEIAWKDGLLRLATEHPDTPHGRAARRRLSGSGEWTVTAGVMAAVAVPAFMKYVRRSKTAEATTNLRRMYDGAVAYHAEHGRFPESAPLTPARPACVGGESSKIAPAPGTWAAPGWQALGFSVDDPHYYRYEFVSDGNAFTARAVGDLDCNGVLSTFERVGTVAPEGGVSGGAGLFTQNELE